MASTRQLAERTRRRTTVAMLGANAAGAIVVFLYGNLALPTPRHVDFSAAVITNVIGFAVAIPITGLIALRWSRRLWAARFAWANAGRAPTERELERTLRYPLSVQRLTVTLWGSAVVIYTILNGIFSAQLGVDAAWTITLGGLVTCATGYLISERMTRPLTAVALATGPPARPQLPGVAARAILTWTLGAGVCLLGIALLAIGGLTQGDWSLQRLSIAVLSLSVVGFVVGLALIVALARTLADPVDALRRALARVEQGDLEQEVEVDDGSEIGLLQAGFNQMVGGLRERERLRDLFGRHVGEDVARQALQHGAALGGEARDAAVLFVDIQGSTTIAETRDPTEVVTLLNDFFGIVVEVVGAHDGWINKFEGDAALCVFGAPLADPDAASHALAAARALRDRLANELDEIAAGIGVSAGRVVAGNIGAAKRYEYTVIGDPVNEAARLSELAKSRAGRLLVSEAALARAREGERAHWELCDQLTLRGRSAPTGVATPMG